MPIRLHLPLRECGKGKVRGVRDVAMGEGMTL